jgi:multimeric flavodoxin WrbA
MTSLLVVYHSQSGACARLARSASLGAGAEASCETRVLRACDASVEDLALADGLLLVAAENSGALAGGMKDFLDRTFYPAIEKNLILPYALLISAGNDGRGAAAQAHRILSGYPFPAATEALILRGQVTQSHRLASEELGLAFATGLVMGIF